jgi:hypothetical protein
MTGRLQPPITSVPSRSYTTSRDATDVRSASALDQSKDTGEAIIWNGLELREWASEHDRRDGRGQEEKRVKPLMRRSDRGLAPAARWRQWKK